MHWVRGEKGAGAGRRRNNPPRVPTPSADPMDTHSDLMLLQGLSCPWETLLLMKARALGRRGTCMNSTKFGSEPQIASEDFLDQWSRFVVCSGLQVNA